MFDKIRLTYLLNGEETIEECSLIDEDKPFSLMARDITVTSLKEYFSDTNLVFFEGQYGIFGVKADSIIRVLVL